MTKLIDKDALVAEIKRLAEVGHTNANVFDEYRKEKAVWLQQADVCDRILSFINTLEVKEVDLDKYINKYFKKWYVDLTDQGNILHSPDGQAGLMSVKKVARHFFELGLKAKQG